MLGWLLAPAAAVIAAVVVRALRQDREEPPRQPVEPGSLEEFLRGRAGPDEAYDLAGWIPCPVCGCPTAPRYCEVCEWDDELPGDGLAPRRASFEETGSIYSAAEREQWMGTLPGPAERSLQHEIVELTARARGGEVNQVTWWVDFTRLVEALREARTARVLQQEGPAE